MGKTVYVIVGYNIVDGIYCNGVYEDKDKANTEALASPNDRRVLEVTYFEEEAR